MHVPPEQLARQEIDRQLSECGWIVQDGQDMNIMAGPGVAGATYDGFGRPLHETPPLARLLVGEESLWAGWSWFATDTAAWFGLIGLGYVLITIGNKIYEAS